MRQKRTTVQRPVNDCYLSPKPRRDDVPVTRPNTFSALTEMKHCEVPDSFHSLSTLSYAACAACATLCSPRSLRHATLHPLSAPQRARSAFRATARPLRFPRHSAPAPLSAPCCATLRSLRYTAPCYAPCATMRPITRFCASQCYSALHSTAHPNLQMIG